MTTPSTSAARRFWLSFHLASIRVIETSRPTIARSWPAMYGVGASSTDHGGVDAGFVLLGQPPDQGGQPSDVVVHDQVAVDVRRDVVPGGDHPAVLGVLGYQVGLT